jgi:SLOG in TRPM, prokaryote
LLGITLKGRITHPEIAGVSAISDGAPLESNHSHFVLVESAEWGGETGKMFELAPLKDWSAARERTHDA